ncbi:MULTISPECIES: hypothetical protein [unclassified Spirillospora]|uniref:hypothetical protein n=1 Tax=unclassified Spirillospora TaxID=2642701 RepID=UPI003712C1D0
MNRSVRNLLSVSVLAPVAAAFAVAAAPANAAPGPSTTLLYEAYAAAAPVAQTLPEPVTMAAGQTAELTTGAVDGVLQSAPAGPGYRTAARRCTLNPGKAVNSHAGTTLPETSLLVPGQTPLGALPDGDCLGATPQAGQRTAGDAPVPPGSGGELPAATGDLPGMLLGSLTDLGGTLGGGGPLGGLPGGGTALPNGRYAEAPLSTALPDLLSRLGSAQPAGLAVGTTLFPPAGRHARPGPADDVLGQANDAVNEAGAGLDAENGVGQVVEVLKSRDRVAAPADGPLDGPVSLLDTSGLGLPGVPGLG